MPKEAEGVPIKVGAFCFLDSSRGGEIRDLRHTREQSTWFKIRNPRYSQWEGLARRCSSATGAVSRLLDGIPATWHALSSRRNLPSMSVRCEIVGA